MNNLVRRGRPKDPEKQRGILEAAAECFMTQGLEVSMDAISKKAGVSKQTLYSHFDSKDDLFEQVIACKVDVYFDEATLLRFDTLEAELRDRGQRVIDMLSEPNVVAMGHAVAAAVTKHPALGDQFFVNGPDLLCAKLQSTFERHDPDGRYAPHQETAQSFVGALAGHLMMTSTYAPHRSPSVNEGLLERTVARFVR